jgi:Zn-dependent protease with chaperone function
LENRWSCSCTLHGRRLFTHALMAGGLGMAGTAAEASIAECRRSKFTKAVPAEEVEGGARQQYRQLLQEASSKRALLSADEQQVQRLRYIAQRMVPYTAACNDRARSWKWEVNLLASRNINAFCMPGGKIAFYYGILSELQLDDDEVAMIMGHEIAHALLEHAREQFGKNVATTGVLRLGAALFGLGQLGDLGAQFGAKLFSLKFSRDDETEADSLGLLVAASAGYDPRKGVSLWQKMMAAGGAKPPPFLSTHPASNERVQDIEARLPQVLPLYQAAAKPERRYPAPAKLPPEAGARSR